MAVSSAKRTMESGGSRMREDKRGDGGVHNRALGIADNLAAIGVDEGNLSSPVTYASWFKRRKSFFAPCRSSWREI